MNKEIHIIPGLHTCGKKMDMRILEDEEHHKFWLIYGICYKCEIVAVTNIFDHKPVLNVDFIVDFKQKIEGELLTTNDMLSRLKENDEN